MKHGAFFNGIGGFMYAAELMAWENVFYSEINPFCNRVVKYYYPNAIQHGDIKNTDFTQYRGVDIFTGGFPCQPFSNAGGRNGTDDPRYLWPPFFRAIKQGRPRWCVLENVTGITSMVEPVPEIVNVEVQKTIFQEEDHEIITEEQWYVLERICTDLESIGYTVQPIIIPAAAVGAPHRRDRIWIIAHSECWGGNEILQDLQSKITNGNIFNSTGRKRASSNSNSKRSQSKSRGKFRSVFKADEAPAQRSTGRNHTEATGWEGFPSQSPVCSRNDGLPAKLDGITVSTWRIESVTAFGNAIVPQVAIEIFKAIEIADYEYRTRK